MSLAAERPARLVERPRAENHAVRPVDAVRQATARVRTDTHARIAAPSDSRLTDSFAPMDDTIHSGQLLVATPSLADPNFRRTVILVVEHEGEEGTLGVVLNRPSEVPVSNVLPPWADLVRDPSVVFQGGPVARDSALCLASLRDDRQSGAEEPLGWRSLEGSVERLGLVDLDAPPEIIAAELGALRVFAGYAGWGQGQLESEIREGAWYLVASEPGDPFAVEPGQLWRDVLRRQGGDLALVSTFPEDPTLN